MSIHHAYLFAITFALSISCVYFLSIISRRFKFLINSHGISITGGIAIGIIYGSFLLVPFIQRSFFFAGSSGIILPGLFILAGEFWDDIRELSVIGKVFIQIIACVLLIGSGVRTHILFLNTAANVVVTAVWIIAITNAFNLLDIMDGLCAGVTIVIASGLLFVCILSNDIQNAVLLLVMIGSVGGFLMFNMPPAKVYLGNAGSHFLGFMLAAISINISYASLNHEVSLLSPLLIMGFPIYDTFFVAILRIKNGRSAVMKSKDHLALRFLKIGYSHNSALFHMVGLTLLFVVSGIIIVNVANWIGVWVIICVLIYIFALTNKMSRIKIDG